MELETLGYWLILSKISPDIGHNNTKHKENGKKKKKNNNNNV